jgi:hypothetical protein
MLSAGQAKAMTHHLLSIASGSAIARMTSLALFIVVLLLGAISGPSAAQAI